MGGVAPSAVSPSPALRLIPSGQSLALGFGLLAAALALYVGARESTVFAVRDVQIESAPPAQARLVRRALAGLSGTSLLQVGDADIQRRLASLPHVHLLGFDRAFPDQLRVRVSVERPAAVLRRGADRWLVSSEARVLRELDRPLRRPLPVVWASRGVEPEVGAILRSAEPARGVKVVAALRAADPGLARTVWYVKTVDAGLVAVLHDRLEVRLGDSTDLGLKLAAARQVLATLRREEEEPAGYVDVSVPQRPVAGTTLNSEVKP